MITKSNQAMEENQKKKFICKFCNKKFPCGKSLGGHIRTHLNRNGNSARKKQEEEEKRSQIRITKFSSLNGLSKSQRDSDSEVGLPSGYELRMNPKKSLKFTNPRSPLKVEEKFCKECGKGFQSLKALCGHMACHADKEKLIDDEDDSEATGKQKLVMDSQSDTETSGLRQRRISKGTNNYKKLEIHPILGNGSSSVSGIQQEQQEVAISLMMLSRDCCYKGGLNSFAESSSNNSVILEAKSSSIDMVGSTKEGVNSATKIKDFVKMKKTKDNGNLKLNEISVSENSDSGYFRNGHKKIEQDVSAHGFQRINNEDKKIKVEFGSGNKGCGAKFGNGTNKLDNTKAELLKNLPNKEASNQVANISSSKYELRKRTKDGFCKPKFLFDSCNKETNSSSNVKFSRDSRKRSKIIHSKNNGCSESMYESGENSIETDDKLFEVCSGKNPNKKNKGHECPICFRVFKSGQALGGHKRSHFIGSYENKTVVIRQESSETEISRFFDLNLPAPVEEEPNGNIRFMAW